MAGIALSLLAAYAGPDRLVDCCVYEGRVFVAAGGGAEWAPGNMRVVGGQAIGIAGGAWWTTEADPRVQIDDRDVLDQHALEINVPRLSELVALGCVWRCVAGRYGYELQQAEGLGDGVYVVWLGSGAPTGGMLCWIGPSAPATEGHAIYDVDDTAWSPTAPDGMVSCRALAVSGGVLWAAGTRAGGYVLAAYDGTWFWQTESPELLSLWDVDGLIYGVGGAGCYRWKNWALEQVAGHTGFRGASAAGEPIWIGGNNSLTWWRDGDNVWGPGRRVTLSPPARDIRRYAGRTYVVTDGELGWIDGARARSVVGWDGAVLDNLTAYQNRLYAMGELDGAPRMLEFGGARSCWVDAGRWRIARMVPGARTVAIGTPPGGVGQVVLQTAWGVRLDDLASEWADGSGASPRLDSMASEWSKGPDNRPRLDSMASEWADGTGASPQLDEIETAWSDGSGDGRPELGAVTTEWQDIGGEGDGGVVMLEGLATEWADAIAGPETGEYVVFVTDQFEGAVTGVRLVLDEPLSVEWRAMLRLDREALAVDAWDSYEALPVNVSHVPEQTGSDLRIAIIGPWADVRCPGIRVQVRTDAG